MLTYMSILSGFFQVCILIFPNYFLQAVPMGLREPGADSERLHIQYCKDTLRVLPPVIASAKDLHEPSAILRI